MLGLVGFAVEDGAGGAEDGDHEGVLVTFDEGAYVAPARVVTGYGHMFFDADGDAVERADGFAVLFEMVVEVLSTL